MTHPVGLIDHGLFLHAWVLDLPGCIAGGRDLDEVAEQLPLVIADYLGWLRRHGEPFEWDQGWEIAERVGATQLIGGDACFAAEREPMSASDIESAVARLGHARGDLLGALNGVPDAILDWVPPMSAFDAFDAWAPEVRTIRGLMGHVLQFEIYYRDGLRDGSAAGIFESAGDPAAEQALTAARLRALSDEETGRVFRPLRPGQPQPEEWTARKMLRRMLSHERAHTAEIWQRRSWVLLGPPRLGR